VSERVRAERLTRWATELRPSRWARLLFAPRLRAWALGPEPDALGSRAVLAILRHNDRTHAEVLALLDELLEIGAVDRQAPTEGLPVASATPRAELSLGPERAGSL
jgi:hypothetical protein